MPDEELNEQAQEETQEGAATEQEAAPSGVPTFDADAERARIREELRAEMEAQSRPAPEAAPEDPAELIYTDPARALQLHGERVASQIMSQVQPLLNRVNQDALTREIGDGLGDAGKKYLRDTLGNVPVDQLPPQLREMARLAAENVDRKATPVRTAQERPYGMPAPQIEITDADRQLYGIGTQYGPTEEEVRAWKKEELQSR